MCEPTTNVFSINEFHPKLVELYIGAVKAAPHESIIWTGQP